MRKKIISTILAVVENRKMQHQKLLWKCSDRDNKSGYRSSVKSSC